MKKENELEPLRCVCKNHPDNLDIFKEEGTWIILCHECDCMTYSEISKDDAINEWNDIIESEKDSIHKSNIDFNNEMHESMYRWIYNISVRWKKENGNYMTSLDMEEMYELFSFQLEDINNKISNSNF
jgi:hypothetical protein